MQRLEGRTVLVTGAGSGIGKASAIRIASEGASVFCVDLNGDAVEATASQIRGAAGEATACIGNLGEESSVNETVKACIDRYSSLHGVVNMAGILRFDDTEQLQTGHCKKSSM